MARPCARRVDAGPLRPREWALVVAGGGAGALVLIRLAETVAGWLAWGIR